MKEIFKDIKGYEGLYAISNKGRVWGIKSTKGKRKFILKPYIDVNGYLRVELTNKGKGKKIPIHRMVAQAFIGDITNKIVHHIDENKMNNNPKNLELMSHSQHSIMHHLGEKSHFYGRYGELHPLAKKVICIETGKIYNTILEARNDTGARKVSECCNKKRKTSNHLHFKFYEELENVS